MTDAELEAIAAAAAAAAPGPWTCHRDEFAKRYGFLCIDGDQRWLATCDRELPLTGEFIAGSRTWVPQLLAELDRVRGELKRADEMTDKLVAELTNLQRQQHLELQEEQE